MTLRRTGLCLALLAIAIPCTAAAQTTAANSDPANLKGERVNPRTGLELPIDQGAAGLQQTLLKLRTRASLLMIVAHPDDEDGGMLTYEARGQGVRAATLTLTRGEGGQNLMTGDFNDALGLIRTQELLAADRYFGTGQMFGTEVDFGFSKTKEESLAQWTHQRVLYDAVRAVRLFRPLVITSVFVGGPTDGHGHHQVSGQMAQEVFNAAADPKVFPEMGLEPWAPLKVYARVPFAQAAKQGIFDYATGKYVPVRFFNYVTQQWTDAIPRANVVIHEGEYSDKLGMTYVQFARQGLALQKSQIGAGVRVPPSGAFDVGYTRYGSRVKGAAGPGPQQEEEKSFFDGIDTSITGIASLVPIAPAFLTQGLAKLSASIDAAATKFDTANPSGIAPQLAAALRQTNALISVVNESSFGGKANVLHELRIKQAQLEQALTQSLGVSLRAEANVGTALENHPFFHVDVALKNDGPNEMHVTELALLQNSDGKRKTLSLDGAETKLAPGATLDRSMEGMAQSSASSRPYFTRKNVEQAFYDISRPDLRNAPTTPPAEAAWATAEFAGVPFSVGSVVTAPHSDSPLWVLPAISVTLTPSAGILTPGEKSVTISTRIERAALGGAFGGRVLIDLPNGWQSEPKQSAFAFESKEPARMQSFRVTPMPGSTTARLTAEAKVGPENQKPVYTGVGPLSGLPVIIKETFTESFRKVGYPGLPETYFFSPATYRARAVDIHVAPNLRVAYLPGTGDEVQSLLENIGIHATNLTVDDIAAGKLADFDTLVIGTRAYTAHADLIVANNHILDFAKNGGTVVVQYQAHAFRPTEAPFPITLSGDGDRVVEEVAKVELSPSTTGVLDFPNKITSADFDSWIEERGHGFPASWDTHYDAPTETHDAGQEPQRGGILVARYGKGYYAYTAFALYRQLPEAVPGAYRLFANLLSLGHGTAAQ